VSDDGVRIAMWSGPRNISTALLRAWGNRPDTFVCDEPFYAHYLRETGIDHPGRQEILRHHECDPGKVAAWLTGPIPGGKAIFYQKHMAHHLLPGMDRGWIDRVRSAFLIRDPAEMLTSLVRVTPGAGLADTGLPQQWELFRRIAERTGAAPPVLDARDVLEAPGPVLQALCAALGVPFREAMLSWEAGPRPTDGIWARHWYGAVERSTGFAPYRPKGEAVPERLRDVHRQCLDFYERLRERRLRA